MSASIDAHQRVAAKVVGFSYLFAMATGVFAEVYVRSQLVVANEAFETARNIQAHEQLWRIGIATNVLTLLADIALVVALYVILRPIGRGLALFSVVTRAIETAVGAVALLYSFDVLALLGDAPFLKVFGPEQLHSLARLAVRGYGTATSLTFIFLGVGSATFAVLWYRSGYIPKWLASLGVIGSALIAGGSFAIILMPTLASTLGTWHMLPLAFFEVAMGLLLLSRPLQERPAPFAPAQASSTRL